jgi:hypothetical protein
MLINFINIVRNNYPAPKLYRNYPNLYTVSKEHYALLNNMVDIITNHHIIYMIAIGTTTSEVEN